MPDNTVYYNADDDYDNMLCEQLTEQLDIWSTCECILHDGTPPDSPSTTDDDEEQDDKTTAAYRVDPRSSTPFQLDCVAVHGLFFNVFVIPCYLMMCKATAQSVRHVCCSQHQGLAAGCLPPPACTSQHTSSNGPNMSELVPLKGPERVNHTPPPGRNLHASVGLVLDLCGRSRNDAV